MRQSFFAVLAVMQLLTACSDPEQSARGMLDNIQADWNEAQAGLDPVRRISGYQSAIEDFKSIINKYPETQVGAALAAGRTVNEMSLATMQDEYDRLTERAACYAEPSSECLMPFASRSFRANASGSANDAMQQALRLVCEQNFTRADAAFESLKINRPVYAANLVQVALRAAECGKPDEVKAAVTAYMAAEPAQGSARITRLMSILQTDALRVAWPDVFTAVENEMPAAGLDPGSMAGTELTLAVKYAEVGNADTALAKFRHITTGLGYGVDIKTRIELAASLIASGNTTTAMEVLGEENATQQNARNRLLGSLHRATALLGGRLGIIRPKGATTADIPLSGDLDEYFSPVDPAERQATGRAVEQIEDELDKFVAPLQAKGEWLGMSGAETIYGMLALIQQKLGYPDKASALVKKAEDTRAALSRPGTYKEEGRSYLAEYQLLVALGQGDTDRATALLPRLTPVGNDNEKLIFVALARKGEAEKALTLATQINRAGPNDYQMLINEMAAHGHADKAVVVLDSFPGRADLRAALAWGLVEKAAQGGDLKSAGHIAEKYSLLNNPAYRLRMAEMKAEAAAASKDRGAAEAALREMFTLGEELDKVGQQRQYYAQNAAAQAFRAGYVDLGIELYRAASHKDQRPFFEAFSEQANPADFPRVLLVAHDNLRGESLGYVIDSAIRRLGQ